ncbi:MAG: DUF2207 domain-containing protein, partial [Gammaproteobacteria bacterium]
MTRPLLLLLLLITLPAHAAERVLDFHSEITIRQDSSMEVTETIVVRAEGAQIRRGIYRDFPTDYRDRLGNRYRVGFELLGVWHNGTTSAYHIERLSNGIRIYIGERGRTIPRGEHRYRIRYRTNRQLGFFEDHDELYWNVNGTGWGFPFDHISATVHLPPGIPADTVRLYGYTGTQGARGQDYRAEPAGDGTWYFEATRPLRPRENLSIVLTWPKGHVTEPDWRRRLAWLVADNPELPWAAGVTGLLLLYYLVVWMRVGRDPEAGVIIPLYHPPEGFSPAAMRYIRRLGGYDRKTFATALVNLAVQGFLRLEEKGGDYTVFRTEMEGTPQAPGEAAVLRQLVPSRGGLLALEQRNHKRIGKALRAHEAALMRDYEKKYFFTNSGYLVPGILLLLGGVLLVAWKTGNAEALPVMAFVTIWLSIWTYGLFGLLNRVWNLWRQVPGLPLMVVPALFLSLFSLPFIGGEVVAIAMLREATSTLTVATVLCGALLSWLFQHLLKAPTLAGRRLLDRIEGFRQFLELAGKDELEHKTPLGRTPEQFEAWLPHALALDVEQRWAEKFASVLTGIGPGGRRWSPGWYSGSNWSYSDPVGFTTAVGAGLG